MAADSNVSEDYANEDHFLVVAWNGDQDASQEAVIVGDMWNRDGVGIDVIIIGVFVHNALYL